MTVVNLDHVHAQSGWVDLDLESLGVDPRRPYVMHDLLTGARYQWQGGATSSCSTPPGCRCHVFSAGAAARAAASAGRGSAMTAIDLLRTSVARPPDRDPRIGASDVPASDRASQPVRGWYKDAVIYEVHVRAFRDGNGDGIGDFRGLIEKLDYLQELGVTALWLLPFYPSPLRDDGYDISDYRQVHPSYGTLRDFRAFLREAHRRGHAGHHRAGARAHLRRAPVVPAGPAGQARLERTATSTSGATPRTASRGPGSSSRTSRRRTGPSTRWPGPTSGTASTRTSRASTTTTRPCARPCSTSSTSGSTMGVDGLRLDAVPYLYAREGTTCENLPETFDFLRQLRAHIDERFDDRMLLAEANQWPEDAVAYMGQGDICHMAFHFPLMPRMFMAARQEDRFPIVDILAETPTTPPDCQWALFLRNHDELTLEMVTDEERDYMYRAYAQDPQARVNVGIRRRLAPLLGNDRKLIEMMNGLLFSHAGDADHLLRRRDRDGRQHLPRATATRSARRCSGTATATPASPTANPQRLYLPVIIDPEYHSQAVNVEAQQENPNSLLWWMKRLDRPAPALQGLRPRHARGAAPRQPQGLRLHPALRRRARSWCVVNLSRHVQCVELDLSEFRGAVPDRAVRQPRLPRRR